MKSTIVAVAAVVWIILLGIAPASEAEPAAWPQFRGLRGDGHSRAVGLPTEWSETKNVTWKTPMPGRGCSSPVVRGEQIWMTTALETLASEEEKKEMLAGNKQEKSLAIAKTVSLWAVCVHRRTGKLLHNVKLFDVERPRPVHKYNSYASPTPVIEPGRLYCDFGRYGTACLDTATGRILWKRCLPIEHQVGPASSPLLCDNLLVVVRDGCDAQYIAALDKQTGETVWKTDRPPIDLDDEFKKGCCTPLLIEQNGRRQLVVPGAKWVVAYKPATGEPIWQVDYVKGYSNTARPVFGHGMVFVCTEGPGQQMWAIRVDGHGDVTETHVAWKLRKQIPKRASPLLVGDELYVVSDNGVATCFDALTGSTHWAKRIGGNYAASPVYADGRIYFFNEEGKTVVFRPGKKADKLAENHIDGRLIATPAFVGKTIFLRTATHLYRIEKR